MFDSRCHMDLLMFRELPQVQAESWEHFLRLVPSLHHESLEGFITSFCRPSLWREHLDSNLVQSLLKTRGVFHTIGVHPEEAIKFNLTNKHNFRELEMLLRDSSKFGKCKGVGSCGLSFAGCNPSDQALQAESLKLQAKLSLSLGLPLLLSLPGSSPEESLALKVLQKANLPPTHPLHRDCGPAVSLKTIETWLRAFPSMMVGLSLATREEVVRGLPSANLLLETDSPQELRGGYNSPVQDGFSSAGQGFSSPVHLIQVAERVAGLRKEGMGHLFKESRANLRNLYKL